MPHLMNCDHSEEGWCLSCVKALNAEKEEAIIDAGKYEFCLQAAEQRLQSVLEIGNAKYLGLMAVPDAIDELVNQFNVKEAGLMGEINGLRFITKTQDDQIARDQMRLAKIAVAATGCGIQLSNVFSTKEEIDYVRKVVRRCFRRNGEVG